MRRGEWDAAWRISDAELRRRDASARNSNGSRPRHQQLIWDGRPLSGRRVLVCCYHGLGDTVQFIRFLPMLRQIAVSTIVWAQPRLLPLLQRARGIDVLLPLQDAAPDVDHDVEIEIMELPYALRLTLDTLPRQVPYFDVGAARRRAHALPAVGIVWQSGDWDPRRSIPVSLIAELLQLRGIDWRIFQHDPTPAGLPAARGIPESGNILDEAVAMRALDLLISPDTLSAHLGGALAVPTWTLLPAEADWRWMQNRQDTPWYPTMRLFRQREPGDWPELIERVAAELGAMRQ